MLKPPPPPPGGGEGENEIKIRQRWRWCWWWRRRSRSQKEKINILSVCFYPFKKLIHRLRQFVSFYSIWYFYFHSFDVCLRGTCVTANKWLFLSLHICHGPCCELWWWVRFHWELLRWASRVQVRTESSRVSCWSPEEKMSELSGLSWQQTPSSCPGPHPRTQRPPFHK